MIKFLSHCAIAAALAAAAAAPTVLKLRTRVEPFKGSNDWRETTIDYFFNPKQSAIILCDLWDNHWCAGAARRVDVLAPKVAAVIAKLRARGVMVIHAPSDTMDFYKDAPGRLAALSAPKLSPSEVLALDAPKLPIDDSNGGCETGGKEYRAWSREHPSIPIEPGDLISDKGDEVYSVLKLRGIETLFVAGVHTNMCILNRSFAIKQMTKWRVHSILIRDLTDSMYNPADRPYVTHDQGTQLVIEHIEKYWTPTITSNELLEALK